MFDKLTRYFSKSIVFFLLFFYSALPGLLFAQRDSDAALNKQIFHLSRSTISDSDRIVTLRDISKYYQGKNIDSAIIYGEKSIALAKKIANNNLLGPSLIQQGSNYIWFADYDQAYDLLTQGIHITAENNAYSDLMEAYDMVSYIYQLTGVWDKAWVYAIKSIEVKEKHPAIANSSASAFNSLAIIYAALNDYGNAELYFAKSKQGYQRDDNFDNLANCYLDMAKMYIPEKKYLRARNQLDTAYTMFMKEEEDIQVADACETYGLFFLSLDQYDSAAWYYNKALDIYLQNNLPVDEHRVKISMAKIYFYQKQFPQAKQLLTEAYSFFRVRKETALRLDILLWLHKTDIESGHTENAANYFNEYLTLTDSVNILNSELRARELTAQFDLKKTNRENEFLKAKNSLQAQRLTILVVCGIIVLITSVLLSVLYRQKNLALSQVKKLQQQTETNNKELANLNNVKDKLISMIAHDIRSPLASLQNTLSLTIDKILNKEEFTRLGRILEGEMYNLRVMLDNMLLWARQQVVDIKVNKTNFNLYNTVNEIISLYENNIIHKKLFVHNNLPADCEVFNDKDIITTVIRNILSNAIKFTEPGKNIFIYNHISGNDMLLNIKDEGTGITTDVLQKISKREFVSNRGTSNEKGTGLGILFSQELLQKLGANLTIASEPGTGTIITFSIT